MGAGMAHAVQKVHGSIIGHVLYLDGMCRLFNDERGCKAVGASFDKLRMRKIEHGICKMPQGKDLILSLSKDARL